MQHRITLDEFVTQWNDQVSRNNNLTNGTTTEILKYLEKCATESMIIQTGSFAPYDMENNGTIKLVENKTVVESHNI